MIFKKLWKLNYENKLKINRLHLRFNVPKTLFQHDYWRPRAQEFNDEEAHEDPRQPTVVGKRRGHAVWLRSSEVLVVEHDDG